MSAPAALLPRRRAVFISDTHLGARHCHAAELARFLSTLRCERLYLVGDIVDLWWLAQRRASWTAAHNAVIEALHALRRAGTAIIYIPGNHDAPLRRTCGLMLPAMQVRRRAIHVTADGRRLLVVHGDDYDAVTRWHRPVPTRAARPAAPAHADDGAGAASAAAPRHRWRRLGTDLQYAAGDWLYERILTGNRLLNALRRRLGLRYWSLAEFLKRRSGAAERYIQRFVQAGLDDARRRGLDGIVCGHIHCAEIRNIGEVVYYNDGDWVESCTALTEAADGTISIVDWARECAIEASQAMQMELAP